MRVRLERVKNGVALRTSEVLGEAEDLPRVGAGFLMTVPPLDPTAGNVRMILTSPVVALIDTSFIEGEPWDVLFVTENSNYRVTRLKGGDCTNCGATGFNGQDLTCSSCNGLGWGAWPGTKS